MKQRAYQFWTSLVMSSTVLVDSVGKEQNVDLATVKITVGNSFLYKIIELNLFGRTFTLNVL